MISVPMDVQEQFPVRKTKKQKQAFRDAVQAYAVSLGYAAAVEKGSMGCKNLIIGDPENAKYLITAHYDTCARLPFPNLITPCNPVTFIGYQLFVVALFFGVSVLAGAAGWLLTKNFNLALYVWYICYFGLLLLMMYGPANKHNANDNTSGVVTLLEIAGTMPENLRERVCFVLFDLEEAGLVGSSAYYKRHKQAAKQQLVLNLDCVGDGDEIVMFPTKKLKKDANRMASLEKICVRCGEKTVSLRKKGFYVYPSDQRNFPLGVGIAAFRRKKGVGLYCGRIHTSRDTVLEQENVNILLAALTTLVGSGTVK